MSFLTHVRVLFLLLLASLSFPALADPVSGLTCGIYQEPRSQIRVLNHELLQQSFATETALHQYRLAGSQLKRVTLGELVDTTMGVSADGKTITDPMFNVNYALKEEQPCLTNLPPPKTEIGKTCWNDLLVCKKGLYEFDTAELKQLCEDHIDSACSRWEARTSAEKSGQSPLASITGIPAAPVQEYTDTMATVCRSGISAKLCTEAAKAQWRSGQYLAARDLLQVACTAPINDGSSCQKVANLASLTEQDIASPVSGIPVGAFALRETGDPDFTFAEDGRVNMRGIAPVNAQEEKGIIRIGHNKGGAFAFRRAGNVKLIGLDFWNQLKVYHLRHDTK